VQPCIVLIMAYNYLGVRKSAPLRNRFLGRFDVNDSTGCWEWIGKLNHSGYGLISAGRGDYRDLRAHRKQVLRRHRGRGERLLRWQSSAADSELDEPAVAIIGRRLASTEVA
jgi:hypothetical protein